MAEDVLGGPEGFVIVFGSGLALHREGGQMFLQVAGGKSRCELTLQRAEQIRDDFDRMIRAARHYQQVPAPSDGRHSETSGDG